MGNKILQFLVVFIGFLTLAAPLMGCEPRSPALSALDKQMAELEQRQQKARETNEILAAQSEAQRKLICTQAASGIYYAQLQVLLLQGFGIYCRSGE